MTTVDELQKEMVKFRDERDWKHFHNPKDWSISISLEAAELLEVFQWSGTDVDVISKREKIEEELADVLIYCGLMAEATGLDIIDIVMKKLKRNGEKYPVNKALGNKAKYTELGD